MQRQQLKAENETDEEDDSEPLPGIGGTPHRRVMVVGSFVGVEELYSSRQSFQGFNPATERVVRAEEKQRTKKQDAARQAEIDKNSEAARDVGDSEMAARLSKFVGNSKSAKRAVAAVTDPEAHRLSHPGTAAAADTLLQHPAKKKRKKSKSGKGPKGSRPTTPA